MTPDWLRFDRDTVLRAGAGAGKTQALVTLYLHLIGGASARRRPLAPGGIVAISFTEKAASELSARIRTRLVRLAAGDASAEGELLESARALGVTLPDAEAWDCALAQLGSAPVGTFHRLGGALLRRHSLAAAIDPAFRQLDAGEARARLEAAAEKAILLALDRGDAAVQVLIVELGFSVAGFGSGAVQKLVELYLQRAEQGLGAAGLDDNYQPAALAAGWRQPAADFVAAALRLAAVPDLGRAWTSLQKPLRVAATAWGPAHSGAVGEEPCRRGAQAARDLVAPALASNARGTACREAKDELVEALAAIEACALGHRAAPLAAALARLLDDVCRRYAEDKRRLGALDFSDLIVRARDLLRDHADVREAERLRCEVLLVDEFQDTNAVQAEIVSLLAAGPSGEEAAPDARLLVVGDRKQSIYEFRGADVAVFVGFERAILGRGGARGVLGRSFRSRPSLVTLTNELFALAFAPTDHAAPYRIAWDPATDPLEAARPDAGGPAAELVALDADRSAAMDAGQQRAAEARALAARLSQLHTAGQRDMALLLRAFTQLETYLEALRGAGVPHFVVNGRGFFEAQEVRDLAAALRLLDDPDDRLALVTTLRSPLALVSDETLLRLQLARQLHLEGLLAGAADAVLGAAPDAEHGQEQRRLHRLVALLGELRARADRLGPHAVLRALCDGTDYEASLAGGYQGEQRVANLGALLERARALEEAGGDLRAFVRALVELSQPNAVDLEGHAQIAAERADVVRVMTVHQSKGLEFAVVAVASCGTTEQVDRGPVLYDRDGGLGFKLRIGADLEHAGPSAAIAELRRKKAQAESRRLFYVAATRARDLLILSGERVRPHEVSWRSLVDEARGRSPKVAALLPITQAETLASPRPQDHVPLPAGDAASADRLVARAHATPPLPPPAPLTVAVTQLADFALCARRHQLLHVVGLAEHPRPARPRSPDSTDAELDPLARGTLAHHLLEHADPALAGADLDDLLRAGGYDPLAPDVAEVKTHARRFLGTPFSRGLADRTSLEVFRELPFVLAEPGDHGAPIRLRGQIDLLLVDRSSGDVTVVDYKHARAGSGDDYRFQLEAYALAARRILPASARVVVGLAFLREADPSPSLREQDASASERFAGRLRQLGGELATARAGGRFPGQEVAVCRNIGCGFIPRCHRESL